jgi:hypothetical protein
MNRLEMLHRSRFLPLIRIGNCQASHTMPLPLVLLPLPW